MPPSLLIQANMSEIDHSRFRLIYETYWNKVYSYSLHILKDPVICQDIVQQVFISLWERRALLQIENIEAYLIQSVKFACMGELKKTLRQPVSNGIENLMEVSTCGCDDGLQYKELEQTLDKLLDPLSKKSELMFRMRFEQGMDNRSIASHLELSEKTVRNRLSDTIKLIRQKLIKQGYNRKE